MNDIQRWHEAANLRTPLEEFERQVQEVLETLEKEAPDIDAPSTEDETAVRHRPGWSGAAAKGWGRRVDAALLNSPRVGVPAHLYPDEDCSCGSGAPLTRCPACVEAR